MTADEMRTELALTELAEVAVKITTNYVRGLMTASEYVVELHLLLVTTPTEGI